MFNTSKVRMAIESVFADSGESGRKDRQASVAIILREAPMDGVEQTEVLFIQRAERPGDPWSGKWHSQEAIEKIATSVCWQLPCAKPMKRLA